MTERGDKRPDGAMVFICGSRRNTCHYCSRPATKLCDFPTAVVNGQTVGRCDRKLCGQCAVRYGETGDQCRLHVMRQETAPQENVP